MPAPQAKWGTYRTRIPTAVATTKSADRCTAVSSPKSDDRAFFGSAPDPRLVVYTEGRPTGATSSPPNLVIELYHLGPTAITSCAVELPAIGEAPTGQGFRLDAFFQFHDQFPFKR